MSAPLASPIATKPRLGFLGLGWIGQHRLQTIIDSGCAEIAALADPSRDALTKARHVAPEAAPAYHLEELLAMDLDGLVIATPSAFHAEQAVRALENGLAVFSQKPLGRSASETRRVVDCARAADRLLSVDLSYRFVDGARQVRRWVQQGQLGKIFGIRAVFHNAYGPDKSWFYNRALSGGGCLLDLGIHLVDLALWALDWPKATVASGHCLNRAGPVSRDSEQVEDYAVAQLELEGGAIMDLACSWNLPLGRDAQIEVTFFGTQGGASLKNVSGSFFDFAVERYNGTRTEDVDQSDRAWFGAAAVDWAQRLQAGQRFDVECRRMVEVASVLDAIYEQGAP